MNKLDHEIREKQFSVFDGVEVTLGYRLRSQYVRNANASLRWTLFNRQSSVDTPNGKWNHLIALDYVQNAFDCFNSFF